MGPANSCKEAFIRSLDTPERPMPAAKCIVQRVFRRFSSGVLGDVENAIGAF